MLNNFMVSGWLSFVAARTFRDTVGLSRRIWGGFAREAHQSFTKAGAIALTRRVSLEFPEIFYSEPVQFVSTDAVPSVKFALADSLPDGSSDGSSSKDASERSPYVSETSVNLSQRLNFEGILKSL